MNAVVFDGNAYAAEKERELRELVAKLGRPLKLVSVVIGDDPASHLYVRLKGEAAQRMGIQFDKVEWHIAHSTWHIDQLVEKIRVFNADPTVTGVMVQLPLPLEIRERTVEVLDAIEPKKDVDGLTSTNLRLIQEGEPRVLPATVKAVVSILESVISNRQSVISEYLTGKNVVVVGRSRVLGQPLAAELRRLGGEVTVAHTQTPDLKSVTREAEVLVSATGKAGLITGEMVRDGAVVIDVGEPKGDVEFASVKEKASFITPVPGGVGPMTVVSLLENVVEAAAATYHKS
ncbi:MAG: bifunctional 5,10-methylenetetrahydrofolate dehydrogenase/5,10-methenyltetrahydrofolate cyclohydrolase [Candidatus Chisholmbacteria bacterium]|nr:bifunctional 5,10-methylenetetrahydrofolate dehydrogenase/5,10-methenyltetrahydrofolate cyclohydrolase [Candidatus Chisholmbacteria bacterium]